MNLALMNRMEALLRRAGERVRTAGKDLHIDSKEGIGNYVTDCDVAVQAFLYENLTALLPEAKFLGEESDMHADVHSGLCFVVDPIDGTTNFIRGHGMSAISVALAEDGKPIMGLVYQPFRDEMFTAVKGKGAYLNGRPIHVSERPMEKAIFQMGPYGHERGEKTDRAFNMMRVLFDHAEDLRGYGVASVELCNVACGRCDGYVEMILCPWDYAAGSLILTEAGGIATRIDGEPLTLDCNQSVLSASKATYSEAFALIGNL